MKQTVPKKGMAGEKKLSSKPSTGRRKVRAKSPIIERKRKNTSSAPASQVKKVRRKPKAASKIPAGTNRKAKRVGRAVGSLLGKAIGKVEQAVTRVMKVAKTTN